MAPAENSDQTASSSHSCRRCGTCCRKGGPALHRQDGPLIDEGLIPAETLYTIRPGEPVQDNVAGRLSFADDDIIKIKGGGNDWCCRFLEEATNRCTIYDHRPVECRAMQCWDTQAIEALYEKERLTRRDLLQGVAGLWELIEDHERRCNYRQINELAGRLSGEPAEQKTALGAITDMVKYDESLRQLLVENGHTPAGMLDFLLGRPLTHTLPGFHIQVESSEGRIRLVHSILT
jgi:Fe-S-cluster containining protein